MVMTKKRSHLLVKLTVNRAVRGVISAEDAFERIETYCNGLIAEAFEEGQDDCDEDPLYVQFVEREAARAEIDRWRAVVAGLLDLPVAYIEDVEDVDRFQKGVLR